MSESKNPFEVDFESYIREGEPDKKEKSIAWSIATGLQQVDGLTPSPYLYETAKRNIEGEISIEEAKKLIDSYYESKTIRADNDKDSEEADKVSARITEILSEKSFSFTPNQLLSIHERLFKGLFYKVKAGQFRTYNITKREWALDGDTVLYANADLIRETLNYDFENEKNFDYSCLSREETVTHIARFVANIWQIHPFGEGNTRTTAVFTIKYLRSLGFAVNNEPFEKASWYFRNSLVRANYTNMQKGIYMNTEYLERFFRNILMGENNELKNRFTHIAYEDYVKKIKKIEASSEKTFGVNEKASVQIQESFGVNEKTSVQIIGIIQNTPDITLQEIAEKLGRSKRAVEMQVKKLREQGIIQRVGADKNGHWEINSSASFSPPVTE
ncbi:MAG: Fic family protein [Treponema sp.]|nr:Fic family protein [Treponema sp.]